MKPTFSVLSLTASGVALACAALAWSAPDNHRLPISVADLEARSAAVFAAADADGDGLISAEEFLAYQPDFARRGHPRHGGKPMHGNRGQNEGVTPEARAAHRAARHAGMDAELFAILDADEDGMLSADEFSTAAMVSARRTLMKQQQFERLDGNQDGVLTPEEFPPRRLAGLDADQNGEITRDELDRSRPSGR